MPRHSDVAVACCMDANLGDMCTIINNYDAIGCVYTANSLWKSDPEDIRKFNMSIGI